MRFIFFYLWREKNKNEKQTIDKNEGGSTWTGQQFQHKWRILLQRGVQPFGYY